MKLTKSQKNAVNKLFASYLESLNNNSNSVSFKAPTGSGKTFMASSFISMVIANSYSMNKKIIIIVVTISNSELPKQFAKKLEHYKKFHDFNDYKIDYIESPSNSQANKIEDFKRFNLSDRKVFVFGTASFKKKSLFYQNKVLEEFLEEAKHFNYKIIFIRDEAHIGGEKKDNEGASNLDRAMTNVANFTLKMTATPKPEDKNLIELNLKDMEEDGEYLLKTKEVKSKLNKEEITNEEIIDDALKTFIQSKKDYEKILDYVIRPALLIQISNDSNNDFIKKESFNKALELLEKKLNEYNLVYLKYIDNPVVVNSNLEATLEYASKLDSQIDVVIFKVGPATGWDIPRANMLLQLRDVSSETLNLQTLGRIMRNPHPKLEKNEITNKYFLWSNYQKPTRNVALYELKKKFEDENFYSGRIDKENSKILKDNASYVNEVKEYLKSDDFKNKIKSFKLDEIKYNEVYYNNQSKIIHRIPNMVYLKIYNLNKSSEYEENYKISLFNDVLKSIALEKKKNFEIVKYIFFYYIEDINKIKIKNTNWIYESDPYKLEEYTKAMNSYEIWMDNDNKNKKMKNIKCIDISKIENYGYICIYPKKQESIQYLDSNPELEFAKAIIDIFKNIDKCKVNFFAKMPTLRSKIYFEYFSKKLGKITRSYMDFALKYDDMIFMFEVKSKDRDYDPEKTKELLEAYKIYMDKYSNKKIILILCQYDKGNEILEFIETQNKEKILYISDIKQKYFD